ncbi:TonB-dependent receptor [Altererythrobacter sp. MF3-039]|uniref:TonB-dependent receptor n=1 Tax=Altererythrobacter sp. MF3-039 TaxID=3252901 RepID=UPI00390CBDE6
MIQRKFLLSASALTVMAAISTPANAQTQATQDELAPSDQSPIGALATDQNVIVVTATRREADLQQVSASISAYDEKALEIQQLDTIEDLGAIAPSAQVAFYQGEAQVFLRGVGTPITIGGTDSATALYRDGEFLSRAAAGIPGFFDVQRVEILKGPQGTLYGRNATAGSVLITSNQPTTDWSGSARATFGNYDRIELEGAISGPVVDDTVLIRLAAKKTNRDGYTESRDLFSGRTYDLENQDEWFLRGVVEFRPTVDLTVSITGDYYSADDRANTFFLIDNSFGYSQPPFNPTGPAINTFGIPAGNFGINVFTLLGQSAGNISAERTREDQFSDIDAFNKPEIWGVSGRIDWNIGEYNLRTVTAYRETKPRNFVDFDLSDSPVGQQTQFRAEDQTQFWQDIQLSSPEANRFQFILGGSLFIERNDIRNEYLISSLPDLFDFAIDGLGLFPEVARLPQGAGCCVFELNGRLETEAYAVFLDGSYELTDRLTARAGIRYSKEERSGENQLATELALNNPVLLGPPFTNVAPFADTSFDAFTPKFGLDFQATDDIFLYAAVQRGFKSGGFNIGSLQNEPFDQELTWSYEVGARTELADGVFRFNATGFYYDISDLQVQTVVNNSIVVNNAAGAEVYGVEIEGAVLPFDGFRIDFAGTWLETEITDIDIEAAIDPTRLSVPSDPTLINVIEDASTIPTTGAFNIVGNRLPKAPNWQFRIGAQYEIAMQSGALITLRGDWSYQDDIFFNQFNDTGYADLPVEPITQDGYHWLKAALRFDDPAETWSLTAFIDNITDEEVVTNAVYNGAVSGQFGLGSLAPPRTYGLTAAVRF